MDVEIAFSGFLLQHTFIRVKICFIEHTIVCPNICRSLDIFSCFNNTATALKHMESLLFSVFFIFDMPRIPQSLRERAIGMTMTAVAMNIGCSTRAIRHLRQCFQATGRTEDRPRRGRTEEHPPAQSLPNCHSYCC